MPNWKKLVVSGSSAHLYNLDVTNAVTASYFKGDGSGLTNVNATVVDVATVVDTFTAATTKVVNHNFNSRNILVSVYDNDYNQIIPASVNVSSLDSVTITFTQASTGFAVIAKGGHIVSGSVVNIQEVATQVDTFTSQTTYTATHSFNTKDVFVTVYDNNDSVIIPSSIKTLTTGSVQLTFANSTSGRVVIGKAGHVITTNGGSGVVTWASVTSKPAGLVSGSVSYTSLTNKPVGLLSGSVSYTSLTNKPTLVSGSSQVNFLQLANKPTGLLSGSISYTSLTNKPVGILSGSVSYTSLTNKPTLISGSSQVNFLQLANKPVGILSGSVTYASITSKPTLVSGSRQINFLQLLNKPVGLLSGSIFPYTGTAQVTGSIKATSDLTVSQVITTDNGNSTNYRIGDDVWIGDINQANTFGIRGVQNSGSAFIRFGNIGSAPRVGANKSSTLEITGSLSVSSNLILPNRPAFRVTGAGGAKSATTALSGSYLNVDYQQGSGWNNATGTFTAPIAGLYQVNVVCRTNSNSLGTISQLIVYKNNTGGSTGTPQIMVEYGANTTMNHAGGSTISKLAVGDTLKMVVTVGQISFDSNDNFSVAFIG